MQNLATPLELTDFPGYRQREVGDHASKPNAPADNGYAEIELIFSDLLDTDDLDLRVSDHPGLTEEFETILNRALVFAYGDSHCEPEASRFLQRTLYKINRLKLFWYDDLNSYKNERSSYLRGIRDRIEVSWQKWELTHLEIATLRKVDVAQALLDRTAEDLNPLPGVDGRYFRDYVTLKGYRTLLEIASLDGLVEASQLSRTLGGVGNEVHSMLTRLLVEEYGGGRLTRKHSYYFTAMLDSLGMLTAPEAYFDRLPWEVLAVINHSFLLSERKRYFLRYIGGLLYTEISVPAGFRNYKQAAERLGLPQDAHGYWDVHIKEDERHGQWMLHDVALPLAKKYPADGWELILGYDQQRLMSARATRATARACREAERSNTLSHVATASMD